MRPLRYSINISLDGCVDHNFARPSEDLHLHAAQSIARADALLFGRTTYEMMESAWRRPSPDMPEWTAPFAQSISESRKYVVTSTLASVDWNAEIVDGDIEETVRRLKNEPGNGIFTGGVQLPLALADMGLIDEYEFVVHPVVVGRGPTLFAGLAERVELELVGREEFSHGVVASRYVLADQSLSR
ncbi:deaminase [Rhodococcus sp. RS1C4]|nr:dihydrofolate reductase family protein [Rhodococcus sp. RS1C4]OZC49098.1 deaminase [Rhodococcus sp. RS1C4]